MWLPSLISVLKDLSRFAVGLSHERLYVAETSNRRDKETTQPTNTSPVPLLPESKREIILAENTRYDKHHQSTVAIRSYLSSNTNIKISKSDLSTYEWLAYKCTKAGRSLPWLALALAPVGYWHQSLKGQSYVSVGILPKTHSLMEWQDDAQVGQVGYITAVTPDNTITVEQMGEKLPSVLTKNTYSKSQWLELRPVFITVS